MKAMIWKELWENARWAALGWFALLMAEFYAFGKETDNGLPFLSPAFLLVSPFGCLLIGAALGALQYLPELGRDRWAALLHRPVTRGAIFAGKAWAGLILYLLATGLPLLISVIYVNLPNRFAAPFVPRMVLPALCDMVFGLAIYFAAVLLCLHRARWFGSRGMILLSVIPLTICQLSGTGFLWLPAVAAGLFALAAWGAISESRAWPARGALLVLILTGASIVAMAAATILLNVFSMTRGESHFTYRSFVITTDGQVLISSQDGDSGTPLTTVSGQPVTDERLLGSHRYEYLIQPYPFLFFLNNRPAEFDFYLRNFPRNAFNYATRLRGRYDSPETWYRLVKENYFVGYDRLSNHCLGIIDAQGFHPPGSVPVPFPAPLQTNELFGSSNPAIYWAGSQVYALDFEGRSLRVILQVSGEIYAAARFAPNLEKDGLIVVALPSGLRILDEQGSLLLEAPYAHDLRPSGGIAVTTDLSRVFLQYYTARNFIGEEGAQSGPTYLQALDLKGGAPQEYSLPGQAVPSLPSTFASRVVTSLLPVAPVLVTKLLSNQFIIYYTDPGAIARASLRVSADTMWSLLPASVLCALLALGLARRARLTGSSTGFWTLLVFLFGLPGLLAFLAAADWPVRVRCVSCGQRRAVKEETCGTCREGWPQAPATGTEILEA